MFLNHCKFLKKYMYIFFSFFLFISKIKCIFRELAWELLRYFPKDQLKKIPNDVRDEYWPRKAAGQGVMDDTNTKTE